MRRSLVILILAGLATVGGCATSRNSAAQSRSSDSVDYDQAVPASATATALVFRPPISEGQPPIDLGRDLRQPAAFVGYEEGVTEIYSIQTTDRQVFGGGWYAGGYGSSGYGYGYGGSIGRYERTAYIEKTGVLRR